MGQNSRRNTPPPPPLSIGQRIAQGFKRIAILAVLIFFIYAYNQGAQIQEQRAVENSRGIVLSGQQCWNVRWAYHGIFSGLYAETTSGQELELSSGTFVQGTTCKAHRASHNFSR